MTFTPLLAAVEPEVYWRKASEPGPISGSRQPSTGPSATASVAMTTEPASSGAPSSQRGASARRLEAVSTARGAASAAIPRSLGIGRFGLGG